MKFINTKKVFDWKRLSDHIEPMSAKVVAEMSLKYRVAFKGNKKDFASV